MIPIVPPRISKNVKALCRKLNSNEQSPVYLPITPFEGAEPKECFPNVRRYIGRHGGILACGWRIWELPRVFVEAEFHGVWLSDEGELVDITPDTTEVQETLFLLDPKREYNGQQVNNIRYAIFDHPAVTRFFSACDGQFALMNQGARAGVYGEVVLQGREKDEFLKVEMDKFAAMQEIVECLPPPERNDPCYCGSGLKFKKCHGLAERAE